jgi:hypothetical protein
MLAAVTAVGAGPTIPVVGGQEITWNAAIAGTGAVSASWVFEYSTGSGNWLTFRSESVSGTTSAASRGAFPAPAASIRARVTAISGTDAALTVQNNVTVERLIGANGQALEIKSITELLTIADAATTESTVAFPAGALVLGVSSRVVTAITCTAVVDVGITGTAEAFTADLAKAAGSTAPGTCVPFVAATATPILITPDAEPSDATGSIRLTGYYIQLTPATS